MVLTKAEAEKNLKTARSNLSSKKRQIASARKRADFRGLTVQSQFDVGRLGIESFRAEGKARRRSGLKDIGQFQSELPGLRNIMDVRKQELDFFDMGEL